MSRDALVALITKEVLNVVKSKAAATPSAAPVSTGATACTPLGDRPLLIVCGNHMGKPEAVRTFTDLKRRYPQLKVLLSNAAVKLFEDSKRPFAGYTLNPGDRDFDEQVKEHTSIVILNTSVNYLAKIAQLIADTQATIVVFNALKSKRPVLLTTDGLLHWYFSSAITAKIQSYLKEVGSFGLEVIAADALCHVNTATGPTAKDLPSPDTDCRVCPWAGHCARLCPDRVTNIQSEGAVRFASTLGIAAPSKDVGSMIDHTLLKPDATESDVRKLCDEARKYAFASVCVNPTWVSLCSTLLKGTRVKVCTVVGFPLGATSSEAKSTETHQAVRDGAEEIDMVINVGALKAGDNARVLEDIKGVVRAAAGRTVKVILETGLLTDEEKKRGCELSVDAGADFVKTSTGFGPGGATVEDIALMRRTVGPKIGVKASGGVRDYETAQKMIKAGANRIGASASVAIVKGSRGEKVASGGDNYGYGGSTKAATKDAAACSPDNKSACS